ncbi:hypothetical protein [Xenorhabdus lircayensis]|uniref:Transposase n=1 Tax=Xenorhabdus lircayensis TaxID=2763499 RepID=A0ABS0U372_9GAMM|nr:hypothetical protein [Xenorhabdus lircayensis]MBI6548324.1 hypothetical protein [Xenorhabdus lircayensis]
MGRSRFSQSEWLALFEQQKNSSLSVSLFANNKEFHPNASTTAVSTRCRHRKNPLYRVITTFVQVEPLP